jgi:predicted RNase H-like HicB family nuclease/transposase/predicted RNA binding protein YcfA (HicA-like mRNA interferase family)
MPQTETVRRDGARGARRRASASGITHVFRVDLIPENGVCWIVNVPDLPGCITWGHTREEAMKNARDAISLYIDDLVECGEIIPSGLLATDTPVVARCMRRLKLPTPTARTLIQILEATGFFLARQNGDHHLYRHRDGWRVTLSFHTLSDTLASGTIRMMNKHLIGRIPGRPINDALWEEIKPLLPKPQGRPRGNPPRRPDRLALTGIMIHLYAGIPWDQLPKELGCSGMTCWQRLREWEQAGVWEQVQQVVLRWAHAVYAALDTSKVPAKIGARKPGPTLPTAARSAHDITRSPIGTTSRSSPR